MLRSQLCVVGSSLIESSPQNPSLGRVFLYEQERWFKAGVVGDQVEKGVLHYGSKQEEAPHIRSPSFLSA